MTALYEVVRDNLETLHGAIDDGAIDVKIPKHAKKESEANLDCGLLYPGFARLKCGACDETRLSPSAAKAAASAPRASDGACALRRRISWITS